MKVAVDPQLCNGCGVCEIVCPEVFRMNGCKDKPRAVVEAEVVPENTELFCIDARDCCKPRAIMIRGIPPARRRKLKLKNGRK